MWYGRLTKYYLLNTDLSKFKELEKTCQAICFFYQLWTVVGLLYILLEVLGPPNHDFESFPNETYKLGSWAENEIICHGL